jgi:hypothetical protein
VSFTSLLYTLPRYAELTVVETSQGTPYIRTEPIELF